MVRDSTAVNRRDRENLWFVLELALALMVLAVFIAFTHRASVSTEAARPSRQSLCPPAVPAPLYLLAAEFPGRRISSVP